MRLTKYMRTPALALLTSLAFGWSTNAMALGSIGVNFGSANTYGNEYSTSNWELNFVLVDGSSPHMVLGYIGGISGSDNVSISNDNKLDGLPLSSDIFSANKSISTSSYNFGAKFGYLVPVMQNHIVLFPYGKLGLEKLTSTLTYRVFSSDYTKPNVGYYDLVLNDSFNLQYGIGVTAYLAKFNLGVEYSVTNIDGSQELRDAQNHMHNTFKTPVAGQPRHSQTTFSIGYSF